MPHLWVMDKHRNEPTVPQADPIGPFLTRAERLRKARGISPATLSKHLFANTKTYPRLMGGWRKLEISTLSNALDRLTVLENAK